MNWDASTITALGAIAGVVVSSYFLGKQVRQSKRALAADLICRFDSEFHSEEFRRRRAEAATVLLSEREKRVGLTSIPADKNDELIPVYDVLDFFEGVARFTNGGILDKDMVWSSFVYWLAGYSHCASDIVKNKRESDGDPTLWAEFTVLCRDFGTMDQYKDRYFFWLHARNWLHADNWFRIHVWNFVLARCCSRWFKIAAYFAASTGIQIKGEEENEEKERKFLREELDLHLPAVHTS